MSEKNLKKRIKKKKKLRLVLVPRAILLSKNKQKKKKIEMNVTFDTPQQLLGWFPLDAISRGLEALRTLSDEIKAHHHPQKADLPYPHAHAQMVWTAIFTRLMLLDTDTRYHRAFPKLHSTRQSLNLQGARAMSRPLKNADYVKELEQLKTALNADMEEGGHYALVRSDTARLLKVISESVGVHRHAPADVNYAAMASAFRMDNLRNISMQVDRLWELVNMKEMIDLHALPPPP